MIGPEDIWIGIYGLDYRGGQPNARQIDRLLPDC
jgi:hypothetical protein